MDKNLAVEREMVRKALRLMGVLPSQLGRRYHRLETLRERLREESPSGTRLDGMNIGHAPVRYDSIGDRVVQREEQQEEIVVIQQEIAALESFHAQISKALSALVPSQRRLILLHYTTQARWKETAADDRISRSSGVALAQKAITTLAESLADCMDVILAGLEVAGYAKRKKAD